MGEPTYCTDSQSHRLVVVSSWWGVWEACSAVGISVPKILRWTFRSVLWRLSRGEYTSLYVRHGQRALNESVILLVTACLRYGVCFAVVTVRLGV